ncbi:MAG: PAS domain S-box protein [Alphaproteobacteria bacterium]|nr:PAS domain S-box protein [Alphaproteobacteria bacterium]
MVQLSSVNGFKNIENNLDKMQAAAWVWDADRRRIVAANGRAVMFWQELSVLDLIDSLFGEYHPMSLQFAKAQNLILHDRDAVDLIIDFNSMGINEVINCQFSSLQSDDGRNVILIQIAKTIKLDDAEPVAATDDADEDLIAIMLDNSPAALALFDRHGEFCYANEYCQQIFSKSNEVFAAPKSLDDWFVGDDAAQNLVKKCLTYKIANMSAKLNTAFGPRTHSVIAKSFAIKPVDDGEPYILVYLRDVADERHYEQILIERIAKLEQLTQLGSDFYFILDDELDFVQLGGNFEKLTGYPASDFLGENWQDVADEFELDADGVASEYFAERKSFDNLTIKWPVKDSESSLSLTWRGRSIYEQQNGENIFVGSFVTAYENILAISGDDLAHNMDVYSFSEHVELIEDEDDTDIDIDIEVESSSDTANDNLAVDEPILDDEVASVDDIADLAELDGADADDINIEPEQQTSDIELSALETDLSDVEAVNFNSIGEALNGKLDDLDEVTDDTDNVADNLITDNMITDNVVPAFGATIDQVARFGRREVNMLKLVLDQTPVMAAITSLPSEEGIYTLFANKELLYNLGMIQDKDQSLADDEYSNILSVESMEILNQLEDKLNEKPLEQEVSFLVDGQKYYFNAKINKIDWQDHKALQHILSPKLDLEVLSAALADDAPAQDEAEIVVTSDAKSENAETDADDNIVQFVLDAQAFIDTEQNILSSNIYLNNIVGLTSTDLIGKPIENIVAEKNLDNFRNYMNTVLQDEDKNLSLDGIEIDLINRMGENHTVFMHIQRLGEEEARDFPSNILVNMRDISMWKKKEANLRDAKDRAEHENEQKSSFLARISHELRTPLNAIIGFSEVMSDEKFGPLENSRYKGYAHDINESGEHLLSLINDLLDLSKVEAGKVELNFKALDLEPLIMQSVSLMQPMADKKRIIIRTSISSNLPQIVADMRSIRQIILNLLSNSIKYSNPGSQVILSALMDDDGEVIIRVRDTGIGMGDDQLVAAMEPFKTLNMDGLVDRQGTGLGLPLTKALAEANRAGFSIESAVDAGTLVQITFPTTRVLTH